MQLALNIVLAIALAAVIALRWRAVAQRKPAPVVTNLDGINGLVRKHAKRLKKLGRRISPLEAGHDDLRAAVAHGIEDVTRINNRINASLRRYREEREESGYSSPALDAESENLRGVDGDGGEADVLPLVRPELEELQSSIPGVSAADLAKVRGAYYGGT
jgi:hypothetical protein